MHHVLRRAVALATLAVLAGGMTVDAAEPQHNLRPQAIHADITLPDGSHLRVDTAADDLRTSAAAGVVTLVHRDRSVDVATITCTAALHGRLGTVTRDPADVAADATGATDAAFSAYSAMTHTTYYGFLGVRNSKAPGKRLYAALRIRPDYARCGSPVRGRPVAGTITITY